MKNKSYKIKSTTIFELSSVCNLCVYEQLKKMGKDFDLEKLRGSDNYHTWQFAVISYLTYHELDHTLNDRIEIVH